MAGARQLVRGNVPDSGSEGPGTRSLVHAIVQIGNTLGMGTVAEGVETPAQVEWLSALDCRYAQGYLLAPPMPATEAELFVLSGGARGTWAGSSLPTPE